jgi:hypothetical protein
MRILKSYWTTRTALLAMLLLALPASMVVLVPATAHASYCCGWNHFSKYYSDATYTTLVGQCNDSDCTGQITCWGTETIYERDTTSCCANFCP